VPEFAVTPDFVLVRGGDLYTPEPRGRGDVLIAAGRIVAVGATPGLPFDVDTLDASGAVVIPGLIDPHEHLIGGSGEHGFASQTPEIYIGELIEGAITTVVGCLGVDTVTKTMPALLAKVKGLRAEGLSAYLYTGGYTVPPATLTGSVRNDILFVEEAIGAGEVAIADRRSSRPTVAELARIASEAYTAGMLAGKAGVTHFHVGDDDRRLADVRALLDDFRIPAENLYPTHVERNEALFDEAIDLTRRGVTVDIDVMEHDLARWLRRLREADAPAERLTASSDAALAPPSILREQLADCVLRHGFAMAEVLPIMTANTAAVLKLPKKGRLDRGCDGDVAVLERDTLAPRHVVAGGRVLLRDGAVAVREAWAQNTTRRFQFDAAEEA
jgi:beta-aspartyl-dipeptidase (metallo-type)